MHSLSHTHTHSLSLKHTHSLSLLNLPYFNFDLTYLKKGNILDSLFKNYFFDSSLLFINNFEHWDDPKGGPLLNPRLKEEILAELTDGVQIVSSKNFATNGPITDRNLSGKYQNIRILIRFCPIKPLLVRCLVWKTCSKSFERSKLFKKVVLNCL